VLTFVLVSHTREKVYFLFPFFSFNLFGSSRGFPTPFRRERETKVMGIRKEDLIESDLALSDPPGTQFSSTGKLGARESQNSAGMMRRLN